MITVQNIDKVRIQLMNVLYRINRDITKAMELSLIEAMNYLNNSFPDLKFQSQWFPESKEFWIYVDEIILCKATGKRVNTQAESQIGYRSKQSSEYEFAANPQAETLFTNNFNTQEVADKIGLDTALKIVQALNIILKGK
ncbi:MAG: hypothetical protein IMZ51_04000 [Chloroflexi bacterium]|nr:hypothetical protein [Chloroflexota bacterium]